MRMLALYASSILMTNRATIVAIGCLLLATPATAAIEIIPAPGISPDLRDRIDEMNRQSREREEQRPIRKLHCQWYRQGGVWNQVCTLS
jgi:hypothetical protein